MELSGAHKTTEQSKDKCEHKGITEASEDEKKGGGETPLTIAGLPSFKEISVSAALSSAEMSCPLKKNKAEVLFITAVHIYL